ncbi:diguanylate cyclase [Psychromonas sp. CNPT3]|uniref:sensor domain-containing diguanylate cyclase n=1 Tax=Psychromonas sp. CNPT3 TaxID=314282 RepID=UPI0002C12523|nr:diguanylate cyclase [Psychromonas sp. CNPT3]AGH82436.1 diguanylate cyclase [Psychromonas sp. CNPT3]
MNIKQKMFFGVVALIAFGFAISAFSSYKFHQERALHAFKDTILAFTLNYIDAGIRVELLTPIIISSLMSEDPFVRQWATNLPENKNKMVAYLARMKKRYAFTNVFFVSEKSADYFYSEGIHKKISEKSDRDKWYYRLKNSPFPSNINIDKSINIDKPIDGNDGLYIYVNFKVQDKFKNLLGIIGVGANVDEILTRFDHYNTKYGYHIYLLNHEGKALISNPKSERNNFVFPAAQLKKFYQQIKKDPNSPFFFEDKSKKRLFSLRYIKKLNILICVEIPTYNIYPTFINTFTFNLISSSLLLLLIVFIVIIRINRYQSNLENVAYRDVLTGLSNRYFFTLQYPIEVSRLQRTSQSMVLLMIDIDFFKQINDTQGHLQGDKVLKQCAKVLKDGLRPTDILVRWGGEEFIGLLPDSSLDEGVKVAERLRFLVENDALLISLSKSVLTVSIGLALYDQDKSMDGHIKMADQQLYLAKQLGRNRIAY